MPGIQAGALNPSGVARASVSSMDSTQRSGTMTSPMLKAGSTPPAIPEKTMRLIRKWSIRNWVFKAALTMLTPLNMSKTD
jgi:hypothetical protein